MQTAATLGTSTNVNTDLAGAVARVCDKTEELLSLWNRSPTKPGRKRKREELRADSCGRPVPERSETRPSENWLAEREVLRDLVHRLDQQNLTVTGAQEAAWSQLKLTLGDCAPFPEDARARAEGRGPKQGYYRPERDEDPPAYGGGFLWSATEATKHAVLQAVADLRAAFGGIEIAVAGDDEEPLGATPIIAAGAPSMDATVALELQEAREAAAQKDAELEGLRNAFTDQAEELKSLRQDFQKALAANRETTAKARKKPRKARAPKKEPVTAESV